MEDNRIIKGKKPFILRKRKTILGQPYAREDLGEDYKDIVNRQIFVYKMFEEKFEAKEREVYLARFPLVAGSELHGDHYVVVFLSSDIRKPIMTVIPLKSEKAKGINAASDIRLGSIPGINGGKNSIAVINQIQSIDKCRLIPLDAIDKIVKTGKHRILKEGQEIVVDNIEYYRLTIKQFKLLRRAVLSYLSRNYVPHEEDQLVDN